MLTGHPLDAVALLEEAAEQFAAMGLFFDQPRTTVALAEAYLRAGRRADALNAARRGLEQAKTHQARPTEATALRVLGDVLSAQDPPAAAEAEAAYRDAVALADDLGCRPQAARVHLGARPTVPSRRRL
jgi:tetratricopeptide (TPR) repeat protein